MPNVSITAKQRRSKSLRFERIVTELERSISIQLQGQAEGQSEKVRLRAMEADPKTEAR